MAGFTTLQIKDANGVNQPLEFYFDGTNYYSAPVLTDAAGHILGLVANPLVVSGTVTANAGTNLNTSALALESGGNLATLAGGVSAGKYQVTVATALPAGADLIGQVEVSDGTNVLGTTAHPLIAAGAGTAGAPAGGVVSIQGVASGTIVPVSLASTTVQPGNTPNTTPWLANESDPAATTGTISAADSGTASATNSNGQTVITGSPTANSSVSVTLSAHSGVTIQLKGTTNTTGTFAVERSTDGGTTFVPMSCELVGVGLTAATWTVTDNNALVLRANSGEMTTVRVRCTAKTFTSFAVTIQPGFGVSQVVANQGPPNAGAYAWPVTTVPAATATGLSVSSFLSTGAVQATNVKASAGKIYGVSFTNISATPVYLRLYDKATAPASTDTPIWRGVVPGNTAGSGLVKFFENGLAVTTGIGFRCTAGIADNDATALSANTVMGNVEYV